MDGDALAAPAFKLLAIFAIVLVNAFFVAAEFAFVKLRDTQLDALMWRRAARARSGAAHPATSHVLSERHAIGHHHGEPGPGLAGAAGLHCRCSRRFGLVRRRFDVRRNIPPRSPSASSSPHFCKSSWANWGRSGSPFKMRCRRRCGPRRAAALVLSRSPIRSTGSSTNPPNGCCAAWASSRPARRSSFIRRRNCA